jgi:uncharacterized membrane protein
MTKIIVASFKDEANAMNAMHKLNTLESFGDISIYEKTMVRKTKNGDYEILKGDGNDGWRALGGMIVGGLVGAIGGPIGLLLGLYAGVAIGGFAEINHYDMEDDFIKKIETKMAVGTVSIFAEIDEEDNDFIDIALKPFEAVIIKSNIDFAYDDYMNEQIEEYEDEISEQRVAFKKAAINDKEKIQKKIAELKAKRKMKMAEFDAVVKKVNN